MRKIAIIAGLIITGFAALTAVALFNLSSIANSNKDLLLARAEESLGRKVSLGELTVSVADGVGIRAKNVAVADDPAFSTAAFVRIAELRFTVRLWPLLWKEFRLKRLTVIKPAVTVIRDQQGSYNFDSLAAAKEEKADAQGRSTERRDHRPAAPSSGTPGRGAIPALIALAKIVDGEIRYIERRKDLDLTLKRLDLAVKANGTDSTFAVDLAAALLADQQNCKISGKLGPIGAGELADLPFQARVEIAPLNSAALRKNLAPFLKLPQGLELGGTLGLTDADVAGSARAFVLKATVDGTAGSVDFQDRFHKPPAVPLKFSFDARIAEGLVELRKTALRLRGLELTNKGTLELRPAGAIDLVLESNQFDLSGWDELFPALKDFALTGQGRTQARIRSKLKNLAAAEVELSFTFPNFKMALPQVQKVMTLANATFAVNRVGESGDRTAAKKTKAPEPRGLGRFASKLNYNLAAAEVTLADRQTEAEPAKKVDTLRGLTSAGELSVVEDSLGYQGRLASAQGTLFNIDYKDLDGRLALVKQVVRVDELKFAAMDGFLQGSGQYAFAGPTPTFNLSAKIRGLDIEQYARAVLHAEARRLRGRLQLDATLAGKGTGWEQILATLDGRGAAAVTQGALLNFNLAQQVLTKVTGIAGLRSLVPGSVRKRYPGIFTAPDTAFDELKGSFILTQGAAQLNNVLLSAPDFGASGEGRGDLKGRIDFAGVLSLSSQLTGDLVHAAKEVEYLAGKDGKLGIPFTLKGVLPRVKVKPDLSRLGRRLRDGFLGSALKKLQKKLPAAPGQSENNFRGDKQRAGKETLRKGLEWLLGR